LKLYEVCYTNFLQCFSIAYYFQALVQHDQIKSEILKQNALPLLVSSCQHFSDRSKRLVLDTLGSITFDEEAARVLRDNTEFIKSIEDMQKTSDDGIKKAADKILWNLIKGITTNEKQNFYFYV